MMFLNILVGLFIGAALVLAIMVAVVLIACFTCALHAVWDEFVEPFFQMGGRS